MTQAEPIPDAPSTSFWEASPKLQELLRRKLPPSSFAFIEPRLSEMGRVAASRVSPLAAVADRESPQLVAFDARGRRLDRVDYHPAYREMERIAYGSGIVGLKYGGVTPAEHAEHLHLFGFSLGYLFAMAEMSLFCPVCMTDGVARILTRHGSEDQIRRVVPRLAATDTERPWTGAMFLTERWGGSDVGSNQTIARKGPDGRWLVTGEKWFCSNVDAPAILLTARPEGAPAGTKGLRTFLLLAEGNPGVHIRRLKDKLGVRSMPTGEMELTDAPAEEVGGFAVIAEMLNLSRLYNSVAAAAVIGRAVHEAQSYIEQRTAFARPVVEHPLAAGTLADLKAEHLGALLMAFEAVTALDRADRGDTDAAQTFRILVPIVKAITGKLAVPCVSESMELIGGNAYIEESPLPRLLRDAQVLPIWEGTTNILVLDTLRAIKKEADHRHLLARIQKHLPAQARELEAALVGLAEGDARWWVDRLGRLFQVTLLLEAGEDATAERLLERPLGLVAGARLQPAARVKV